MSIRQRATQCLGKQLPDKTHSRFCSPSRRWPGNRVGWHEEPENSKLIQTSSSRVASERIFRSRETVKAWLESSPSSVVEDVDDESACPSSFESFSSSPAGSVDHLSYTSRFQKTSSGKVNPPGHARSRTISPPRCTANRNSVDLSRIDYSGGSFLMLAFKNAQYRGSSSPPAFHYASEDFSDDHLPNENAEECDSPRSDFSITSEWQYILAAANAAGMSTRNSSGNNSEMETTCEVINVSDSDLDSAVGNICPHPHVSGLPKEEAITQSGQKLTQTLARERAWREKKAAARSEGYMEKKSAFDEREAAAMDQFKAMVNMSGGKIVIPKRNDVS